ncbi:MAG: hypothetical protein FWD35_02500 [Oscillospiraceae bacterium]|nr:hypothetical protein [Oscillospiraceae bacterium]
MINNTKFQKATEKLEKAKADLLELGAERTKLAEKEKQKKREIEELEKLVISETVKSYNITADELHKLLSKNATAQISSAPNAESASQNTKSTKEAQNEDENL